LALRRATTAMLVPVALLAGCASLPSAVDRPASTMRVAPANAPLARMAQAVGAPSERSGLRPLIFPDLALDARLDLMRRAQVSLDLQSYMIGNDGTGRMLLRELRNAAARGVRVRLLLDDLYAQGMDDLLLGLAAHEGVEVRMFNPFAYGRTSSLPRLWHLMTDLRRLNHRMHNKLFVADGLVAVAGGRNLADEYFMQSKDANFIDFDLQMTGAIVTQLGRIFDDYWNSERVYPLPALGGNSASAAERREHFENLTEHDRAPAPKLGPEPPARDPGFYIAAAGAAADKPSKAGLATYDPPPGTVTEGFVRLLGEARSEVIVVSPYFIPGKFGMDRMRALRGAGVSLRVVTNAFGASDEPLVNIGYERYRLDMLRMGVQVFEVTSARLKRDTQLRNALGSTAGRLHAKMGFIDRKTFLVGSMNLDARSAHTNTEVGIVVRSPELVHALLEIYKVDSGVGVYEVRIKSDGRNVEWVGYDPERDERLEADPESNWLHRLKLFLLGLLVPEDLL
jgi:cardiolipin synthase C